MKLKLTFSTLIAPIVAVLLTVSITTLNAQISPGSTPSPKAQQGITLKNILPAHQQSTALNENSRNLRNHLATLVENEKLTNQDTDIIITSEHTSSLSGIHHIYYRQAINNVEVMGTEASLHITDDGSIAKSNDRNLIKNLKPTLKSSAAALTATQAIKAIANQMNYGPVTHLTAITSKSVNGTAFFTKGGISSTDITAKQLYYSIPNDGIRMIWEIAIQEINTSNWWSFRVDATTGAIIEKHNLTVSCNILGDHDHSKHEATTVAEEDNDNTTFTSLIATNKGTNTSAAMADGASYNVYAYPVESPYHGTRTIVVDPADAVASAFGWHDTNGVTGADFTTTRGNNTITVDDIDNNNSGGTIASGGASLVFDFPFDATQTQAGINIPLWETAKPSLQAAITNTFYWTNIVHDITYHYGFNEDSGNFQINNYGNEGAGNDPVLGDVQDGSGTCNANFGTPQDGIPPRMQMFTCGTNDGSFDNLVIVHEYAHGISTRLTGGAANPTALTNQEQQGEGWSDFYGYMYTMDATNFNNDRTVGTFLNSQGPNGNGVRSHAYSGSMTTNPQTYQDLIALGDDDMLPPHRVGEIWASMLYDLTQDLIAQHGFDADLYNGTGGNNIALALVTESLKLQPANPGFVDSRDAILLADQLLYNGDNECLLWQSFADRGLGFSADQGNSDLRADGTAAFDVPSITLAVSENNICLANGITSLGGGIINGGIYSGLGVTDGGDGATFTFDPLVAGIGSHTITYTAIDCNGISGTDTDTITVTQVLPELTACPDITLSLGSDGTVTYDPFSSGEQVDIVGGDNSSSSSGFTFLFLPGNLITQNTTVSFDWELQTPSGGSPSSHSFAYLIGNQVFTVSPNLSFTENGSTTVEVLAGQNFGFVILTANNTSTFAEATVTNFNPGYSGQFDPANWQGFNQNASGTAALNGTPTLPLVSCGEITTTLSQSTFTCLDIGTTTPVTVTLTDSLGNQDTCVTNVTVTGGALNTTTFTGGSWSNGLPTGTSMALINDSYDTATLGDINACSCEIASNQTLTVRDGNFLNVAGNITVDGTLIVENEGSVVQIDENAITTNNGTIAVNKTTPLLSGRDFTVLSSPMTAETRSGVLSGAHRVFEILPDMFTPHPDVTTAINFVDENFDYFAPATALEIGRGNLVFPQAPSVPTSVTLDHTYTQGTLNSGTIQYPLEYNGPTTEHNFNLVGNPYASALDADMLIAHNDAIDQIFYWEHLSQPSANNPGDNEVNYSMDDVSIYNLTGGVAAMNGGSTPGKYIVSGQGFAVIANQSELGSPLTFTNQMRVTGNNGTVRNAEETANNKIWLRLTDATETFASTTLIGFMTEATPDFDKGYDSRRIASTISLYSQLSDEQQLGIQGRESFSNDSTVQLGFETQIDGNTNYVISIDNLSGQELTESDVYLKDNLLDITVNLKNQDYSFVANTSNNPGRFTLLFNEETTLGTEDDIRLTNALKIYPNPSNGIMTLSYKGDKLLMQATVIDVNGKTIQMVDLSSFENTQRINLSTLAAGMYFMRIEMQDTVLTKKIIIK